MREREEDCARLKFSRISGRRADWQELIHRRAGKLALWMKPFAPAEPEQMINMEGCDPPNHQGHAVV